MTPLPPHRTYALGAFRQSVFFIFAVAAFSQRDSHTSTILVTAVFLIDVASWHLCEAVGLAGNAVYNHVWFDTLTNRFTFEKLADRLKYKQSFEVPELIKEGTTAAKEDIERFVRDGTRACTHKPGSVGAVRRMTLRSEASELLGRREVT